MNKFLPMLVLILLCDARALHQMETSSNNFVANASFSGKDESGRPLQFAGYSPSGALQVKAHNGIITVSKVADGTLSLMYPTQVVPIRPNKRYRISVEISTEKLISYVFPEAQIVDAQGKSLGFEGTSQRASGTSPWKTYSFEISTPEKASSLIVTFGRSYDFETGTFFLRNPQVTSIS